MTQNMKSPGNGFLGNIAKELMIVFNEFVYTDSIKKLNVQKIRKKHDFAKWSQG